MDTDDYFWESTNPPYTIKRNVSDRIILMRKDIAKYNKVAISGSLVDWGDELIPLFTLAIRIETDTAIRIDRLKRREREHFGNRIDLGEICTKTTEHSLIGQLLMTAVVWI